MSEKPEITNDLIENPSPRCAVTLVLDISGSMSGTPIQLLNEGVRLFVDEVKRDDLARWSVELAIYTFGSTVTQVMDFTGVDALENTPSFSAGGLTPMGQAVEMALRALDERKRQYRNVGVPYYQPWLVLLSDGAPTDNWTNAAQKARDLAANRKLVSLPIGVGDADLDILSQFSNKPAVRLDGLKFRELFQWLSASMTRVSASASSASQVTLPPMDSWAAI
ncbi:MAG TPA: VWA domain-containing protein [Hydrogenophilus thermoluteolus]|nr:VWA domain-containing protein [Hydrogenophilus thermoluteolus]